MSNDQEKSRLYRLRVRVARAIMPDDVIQEQEDAGHKLDRFINEMHFRIGVAAGYKKALEAASGSDSDYRVEDELR